MSLTQETKKKKILIVDHKMALGGIAIAMLNLIENLKDEYEIEMLLIERGGELEARLPKDLKVHYLEGCFPLRETPKNEIFKLPFMRMIKIILLRIAYKTIFKIFPSRRFLIKLARNERQLGKFDIVINNNMDYRKRKFNGGCHFYSIYNTEADKRFLIIHGDVVKNKQIDHYLIKEYQQYNKILCVSNSLANQFKENVPALKDKIETLYNFQDVLGIRKLAAEEKRVYSTKTFNIVSVSRLCEVKGYIRSLTVFKKLKEAGYNFHWHIIGSGEKEDEIKKFISDNDLQRNITLYGAQTNPYAYIVSADLMYLGSYHEAYGLVLIEALILGVPALSTDVLPAHELLDGVGYVCDNNEEGIYNDFVKIFNNLENVKMLKSKIKNYYYDNDSLKEKFRKLINEK